MGLPIREKSRAWVETNLGVRSDELKKTETTRGTHLVAVLDATTAELVADVARIKRVLGMNEVGLDQKADKVVLLTDNLMTGVYPNSKNWFTDLCELWAEVGIIEYHLLREFWALRYPAGRIAEEIASKAQNSKVTPRLLVRVLENLKILEGSPKVHLPVSS